VAQDFNAFRKRFTEHGDGWSTWLAELDGSPVGCSWAPGSSKRTTTRAMSAARSRPRRTRARRRKSVAAQLLLGLSGRGRVAVLLHVDVANVTNALGVYVSRAAGARDRRVGQALPVDVVDSDTPL
jgi:hypothetical protein